MPPRPIVRLAALVAAIAGASAAQAADFVVSTTNASGPGSLAAAVTAANAAPGPHTISFSVTGTIFPTAALTLAQEVTITGPGPTEAALVIDGSDAHRHFLVNAGPGKPVRIDRLTLRNGNAAGSTGGAIRVEQGSSLTLTRCALRDNQSSSLGGAIDNRGTTTVSHCVIDGHTTDGSSGGAIYNFATLTLDRVTVTNNSARNNGGALANGSSGTLTVIDSTFADNAATANGGGGGAIANDGTATVIRSTFTGNSGVGYGGAIRTDASGNNGQGSLTVVNSTFSGNTGGSAGGAGGGAIGSVNAGTVRILNSTIVSNSAGSAANGGGIYAGSGTTVEITNSVIADNVVPPERAGPDCLGTLHSKGYNLVSSTAGCTITGTLDGNITGADAALAPLADYGGGLGTRALLESSPLRNAGDPAGCKDADGSPLATDQRGIARPQGAACDIGAYEEATALPSGRFQGVYWRVPAGSESGWGMNFAHQGDIVFATWFTYGFDGKPTWFAAVLLRIAPGVYAGDLFTTTGPPFNAEPFDPALVTETTVGTLVVAFSDADNGVISYTVGGVSQTKPITRQLFAAPVPVCTWQGLADLALATNFQGLWWRFPGGSEAGWGVNFAHQGNIIFLTWFTYGADGKPTWLVAVAELTSPGVYSGAVLRVTGPAFNAVPFDTATVVETPVGTITITFIDGNRATYDYTVDGIHQVKTIERQVFAGTGTACQ